MKNRRGAAEARGLNVKREFEGALPKAMAISGAIVIPPGLVLAWVLGRGSALVGGLVGFTVAALHSVVLVVTLKWILKKPPERLPSMLMASYFGRLIALAVVLYGLHFITALNMIALLLCFLVLFITHTGVEIVYAWKAFGVSSK